MEPILSDEEKKRLYEFVGYGTPSAPIWFLGIEESLGKRNKQRGWSPLSELKIRASWDQIIDMRSAHLQLGDCYWERTDYSTVWKITAKLTRGILHQALDWDDDDRMHEYVVNQLGRVSGETLLGEAFPLPKTKYKTWPYPEIFPTREEYENWIWPIRRELWFQLIEASDPNFIICYGKWKRYQEIFHGCSWQPILGDNGFTARFTANIQVYLVPFFGYNRYQSNDLQEIIRHATGCRGGN